MKTYTIADTRALTMCYELECLLPKDWQGTAVDVLNVTECPLRERLWAVFGMIDTEITRAFALWCATQAQAMVDGAAVADAPSCPTKSWSVATQAARATAKAAATYAADGDADLASYDAARTAAWVALAASELDASFFIASGGAQAAHNAARDAQVAHLIEMLEAQ